MKKILIIMSIIISILFLKDKYNDIIIPDNAIRIRIIANSNSIDDQIQKLRIKEKVENKLYKELGNTKDIDKARYIIKNNLNNIDTLVKEETNDYDINYGDNYFPKKELFGIKYNEGNYESLVIKLGESKGNNWWCVLFPPLCLVEGKKSDKNNIEYKSKVLEIINKYK